MKKLLLDTDILIEYLRGSYPAEDFINQLEGVLYISAITVAELYAGVRKGKEAEELQAFIDTFEVINITKDIAKMGGLYRNKYKPSHGTGLADAIIAATAESIDTQVVTFNVKHFPMFENVIKPYKRH